MRNTQLPDSLLIEQFRLTLQSLREPKNPGGICFRVGARKPDLSRLVEYRVLPYLDLKIWENESGAHIPNRVVADAIFPDSERRGEEDVRKTISKFADEVLGWNNLASLGSLVAQEQAK